MGGSCVAQVEMRNHTGITLIDRNDELCILYEKANIQELVYKQGEVTRTARVDEIRLLKLEVQEVQRSVNVTRKLLPQIPLLDSSIASLQDQLLKARQEAEKLSEELESPDNKTRWRRLEGKIPDKEELTAKIKQLEERLNDKKEQLLEKELVLEEISSLADRLRQQVGTCALWGRAFGTDGWFFLIEYVMLYNEISATFQEKLVLQMIDKERLHRQVLSRLPTC